MVVTASESVPHRVLQCIDLNSNNIEHLWLEEKLYFL